MPKFLGATPGFDPMSCNSLSSSDISFVTFFYFF